MDDETAEGDGSRRGLTIDAAGDNVAAHIARHDPAGVLAECEAKRRIVQDHLDGSFDGSELLIAILASIYRHHPDYREECAIDA